MKFCKACKRLYSEDVPRCEDCGKKLTRIRDINEPVRLAVVGGPERAMLTGLLTDEGIPFVEQNIQPQGVSNDLVTGYDVKLSNIAVLVPYSAIPKARDLLLSIETLRDDNAAFIDDIEADIERYKNGESEPERELSPALRTTIKVVTAILFLLLIAAVTLGTDKIIELIKGLFT